VTIQVTPTQAGFDGSSVRPAMFGAN